MTRATQKEQARTSLKRTSSESFTSVTYGFHFWIGSQIEGITCTMHFFQVQLDWSRRNLLLPKENLFWIRFYQSAKRLSLVLSTSAWPSLCASILVFFSIFRLIVFSMLNENFFVTLMRSEEVKKIGNCCCLVPFFIKFTELKCMHTNVNLFMT